MSTIDLGIDFQMPKHQSSQIKVMGVGGGGSNAVNYMFENGIKGVDFVICNTDAQALEASPVPIKIQLGINLTEGLGAGSNPDVGRRAAEESADRITELLDANTKMLFVTAGMGGGTGTGAAPVIAEIAQQKDILTVGVVTVPFATEGGYRRQYADEGIIELKKYVDTLLVIDNEKLIEVYGDLTFTSAFAKANEVLNTATKGIAEVISQHLLVNIDLNDARKVLENSGTAVMGQAKVEGDNRAIEAVIDALDSPLLNDNDIHGAQQVLLKIVTGDGEGEIKMSELAKIKNKIQEAAGKNVNIIEGIGIDSELGMAISVTVIATGFEERKKPKGPTTVKLDEDNFDTIVESKIKDDMSNAVNNSQQKLLLDDEIDFEMPNIKTSEVASDNSAKTIVFDLENDFGESFSMDNQQDSSEEIISSIMLEDDSVSELKTDVLLEEKVVDDSVSESKTDVLVEEKVEDDSVSESKTDVLVEEKVEDDSVSESKTDVLVEEKVEEELTLNTLESTQANTTRGMKIESREREERLRNISMQLRTPSGLTSLEDVPAYKRNNIDISESVHSSESEMSTYTLTNENNTTELKKNNSFLHDNVD
ncbi:MAG: cell division protein FtsZ [Bacteroidota bacterium]|nr:cell division protein FtsZ [Bacteroidota bacterium]